LYHSAHLDVAEIRSVEKIQKKICQLSVHYADGQRCWEFKTSLRLRDVIKFLSMNANFTYNTVKLKFCVQFLPLEEQLAFSNNVLLLSAKLTHS